MLLMQFIEKIKDEDRAAFSGFDTRGNAIWKAKEDGPNFGTEGNLREWVGPLGIDVGDMSEDNSVSHKAVEEEFSGLLGLLAGDNQGDYIYSFCERTGLHKYVATGSKGFGILGSIMLWEGEHPLAEPKICSPRGSTRCSVLARNNIVISPVDHLEPESEYLNDGTVLYTAQMVDGLPQLFGKNGNIGKWYGSANISPEECTPANSLGYICYDINKYDDMVMNVYTPPERESEVETKAEPTSVNPKTAAGAKKPSLMSVIPTSSLLILGQVMQTGAKKYGPFNWRETKVPCQTYMDAALRHLLAYQDGEDTDPESGVSHLGHVMACCAIMIDADINCMLDDDRPYGGRSGEMITHFQETGKFPD